MANERRQSTRRFYTGFIISFILLSLTLAGIVWRGAQTASMAKEAYKFTDENRVLPHRVAAVEEQMRKFNLSADRLIEVGIVQGVIRNDIQTINTVLDKVLDKLDKIQEDRRP